MKAAAIKQMFFSCLFYSTITEACFKIKSSKKQSGNAILTFLNEEMKENALKQIGNLDKFLFYILDTTVWVDNLNEDFIAKLSNKIDERSLESIDQLKELRAKLKNLRKVVFPYLESKNPCFEHKYEKDSKLLGFINDFPNQLDALENTFNSWRKTLKEDFLNFHKKGKSFHNYVKKKITKNKEHLSSTISTLLFLRALKRCFYQLHYYSIIIEYIHRSYTESATEKEEKRKEYGAYINIVLRPLIHPIYECYKNNSTETCDELSNYPQFSLKKFSKVFNFFMKEFSEYFKIQNSNFKNSLTNANLVAN